MTCERSAKTKLVVVTLEIDMPSSVMLLPLVLTERSAPTSASTTFAAWNVAELKLRMSDSGLKAYEPPLTVLAPFQLRVPIGSPLDQWNVVRDVTKSYGREIVLVHGDG